MCINEFKVFENDVYYHNLFIRIAGILTFLIILFCLFGFACGTYVICGLQLYLSNKYKMVIQQKLFITTCNILNLAMFAYTLMYIKTFIWCTYALLIT